MGLLNILKLLPFHKLRSDRDPPKKKEEVFKTCPELARRNARPVLS
jgi:hypothetical protein